jgi:hypothetical protein
MSEDDDVVCGEIETPISFMIGKLFMENTSGGPRCQFVSGFDGDIGIAGTAEYAQVLIGGVDSMKVNYGLVMLIVLVGMRFNRYVVV